MPLVYANVFSQMIFSKDIVNVRGLDSNVPK